MESMTRILRAVLLTSLFSLSFVARADDEDVDDPTNLDGYVGLGGGYLQQFTSQSNPNTGAEIEKGSRELARIEFARIRKHFSLDARVGFGNNYTDFGGVFRFFQHFKFNTRTSTGLSLGLGLGGMYTEGRPSDGAGLKKEPFVDIIAAPFTRFIWDWGVDAGMAFDLEYQIVPYTYYTNTSNTDNYSDVRSIRSRIMLGVSFLFEVD